MKNSKNFFNKAEIQRTIDETLKLTLFSQCIIRVFFRIQFQGGKSTFLEIEGVLITFIKSKNLRGKTIFRGGKTIFRGGKMPP